MGRSRAPSDQPVVGRRNGPQIGRWWPPVPPVRREQQCGNRLSFSRKSENRENGRRETGWIAYTVGGESVRALAPGQKSSSASRSMRIAAMYTAIGRKPWTETRLSRESRSPCGFVSSAGRCLGLAAIHAVGQPAKDDRLSIARPIRIGFVAILVESGCGLFRLRSRSDRASRASRSSAIRARRLLSGDPLHGEDAQGRGGQFDALLPSIRLRHSEPSDALSHATHWPSVEYRPGCHAQILLQSDKCGGFRQRAQ